MKTVDVVMKDLFEAEVKTKDPRCPKYQNFKRKMDILFTGVDSSRGNRHENKYDV